MSFGLFTVTREELRDAAALRQKLELATGEAAAAASLCTELAAAAEQDPATRTWHVVPDPQAGPSAAAWTIRSADSA
jgi:hypothetical protein